MATYRVSVVHGWCGNRVGSLVAHLSRRLSEAGFPAEVAAHSVWGKLVPPSGANLVLQVVAIFTEAETGCPVLYAKPLLGDPDHPETMTRMMEQIRADYRGVTAEQVPSVFLVNDNC
jgi:hypothetical protein